MERPLYNDIRKEHITVASSCRIKVAELLNYLKGQVQIKLVVVVVDNGEATALIENSVRPDALVFFSPLSSPPM